MSHRGTPKTLTTRHFPEPIVNLRTAITELMIRSLSPPEKGQRFYADISVPGFGVRVSQGGTKAFVLLYGDPRRRLTIGRFPTISLAEARKAAREVLAEHTLGKYRPKSITFDDAKTKYLEASAGKNRTRTVEEYRWLLQHFPFKKRQVADITRRDVTEKLDKLSDRPSAQNHALVAIKVFFKWCERQGYLERSPVDLLTARTRQVSRDRVLSDHELAAVWKVAQTEPYRYGPIVRLLILTGQRRTEIASLRWEWINEKDQEITYPANFTKNKRAHTIPFTDTVKEILEALPRFDNAEYLFPASRNTVLGKETTTFNGWSKVKKAFDAKLAGVSPYTLHDLRRTFSSKMAELGTPIHVTEKLLNHVSGSLGGVTGIYNRYTYLPEMRKALEAYEDCVKTLNEVAN